MTTVVSHTDLVVFAVDIALVLWRLFGTVRTACTQRSVAIAVAVHRLPNGGVGGLRMRRSRTQSALTRRFAARLVGDPIVLRVCGACVVDNRLLHSVSIT